MAVQLNDLLNLLRDEFVHEASTARETLTLWQQHPENSAEYAFSMMELLDRCMRGSSVLGMDGFVAYLQHIYDFVDTAALGAEEVHLRWLEGWSLPAQEYLKNPAARDSVDCITTYLLACPTPVSSDVLGLLSAMLSILPALPEDNESPIALDEAVHADISLATDGLDPGLLSALLADAPEQLERLAGIIDGFKSTAVGDPELLLEGQRIAHTLKGSALIVGLPGIGNLAHRLEDVMEFVLGRAQRGELSPASALRDVGLAVSTLEQMVSYLQGDDAQPLHAQAVLQRMLDWVQAIANGEADAVKFPPLVLANGDRDGASNEAVGNEAQGRVALRESATLRVGVDQLSRLVRRAGQSIVQTQRLNQLLRDAKDQLRQVEEHHVHLTGRLRELEIIVSRQVVQLREQEGALDPLEMDRYDTLYTLSRFIAEASDDKQALTQHVSGEIDQALAVLREEAYALRHQHRELLDARLVPVATIMQRLRRNVAQTAASLGKHARLEIAGEQTTLDADVLARLTEPLLHMLRNAVDHGIESSDERSWCNKPLEGLVKLSFRRLDREIEVVCEDDGRGLDLSVILARAIEYGLVEADANLSTDEIRRLILRPGFSTKTEVTEVSGRGVGMDVVNERIHALKGRLDIESTPAAGTRIILHVPVSTGSLHALIVRCAGEVLAIPSDQIASITSNEAKSGGSNETASVISYNNKTYPYAVLSKWLGFDGADNGTAAGIKPCVIVHGANGAVAVEVDEVLESRELILQDVGRLVRCIPGLAAGTLRADGTPMFLLDMPELERATSSSLVRTSSAAMRRRMQAQRIRVMVVDDALSVRRSMEQLFQDNGYSVALAVDGFDALEKIEKEPPAILVTDLEMPNLNGLELTRRLRSMPQWDALPIVMITSRATDKHRDMANEAGVDLYLSKPYADIDLLAHLRRLTTSELKVETA